MKIHKYTNILKVISFYYERTSNKYAQINIISILCFNIILIMWVFGATFKLNLMLLLKIEKK